MDASDDEPLRFSWATAAIFALLVLDVSTEIGEYFAVVVFYIDARTTRQQDAESKGNRRAVFRRAVVRGSIKAIAVATVALAASGAAVARATRQGLMDWRMVSILEGLGRMEAAVVLFYVSVKTPGWTGIYHSPTKSHPLLWAERALREASERDWAEFPASVELWAMQDVGARFGLVYFLLLPFVGHPLSFVAGTLAGFVIDACLWTARRSGPGRRAAISGALAIALATASAVMFTSCCHYIQTVWRIRLWKSEWGLAVTACLTWVGVLAFTHWCFWADTREQLSSNRRISTAAKRERLAFSLVVSFLQRSSNQPVVEDDREDGEEIGPTTTPNLSDENKSMPASAETTRFQKGWWGTSFTLWLFTTLASLFIVVVNIGAAKQMEVVKQRFASVHAQLYANLNEGPVCGLDRKAREVRTFASRDLAHLAGHDVVHCGACGRCSNWHNLRLEYTTRAELAKTSAACARKSLWGGGDAVLRCLQEEPIGFQQDCAQCWTDDVLCARRHCAFLFLQSTLINKIANFTVSEDAITSATCEEAMCEEVFVPCSGASRRRMNIKSGIERPIDEQCTIVDVDWGELFGDSDGGGDERKAAPSSMPHIYLIVLGGILSIILLSVCVLSWRSRRRGQRRNQALSARKESSQRNAQETTHLFARPPK